MVDIQLNPTRLFSLCLHGFELNVFAQIMLRHNMEQPCLYNTEVIEVRKLMPRIIETIILTRCGKGNVLFKECP